MYKLKIDVEKYIKDNYTDNPIHFFGTEFDSNDIDSWIQVKFSPLQPISEDSLNECIMNEGLVEIYAYADNTLDTLKISGVIQSLMRESILFTTLSSIPMETNTFDNGKWYTNSRITVRQIS